MNRLRSTFTLLSFNLLNFSLLSFNLLNFSLLNFSLLVLLIPSILSAQNFDEKTQKWLANLEVTQMNLKTEIENQKQSIQDLKASIEVTQSFLDLGQFKPKFLKQTKNTRFNLSSLSSIQYKANEKSPFQKINLQKNLNNQIFLVNLWATWCKPCISAEEQRLVRLLETRLKKINIPVIAMATDEFSRLSEDPSKWYYPVYHLKNAPLEMLSREMIEEIGLIMPLFLLVNAKGQIIYYLDRALDAHIVDEMIFACVYAKLNL
jgi:thiol-disulfide isomerase/thioredoxin